MGFLELQDRIDLYADYLNNGGCNNLWDKQLVEDLMKVKRLDNGLTDVKTISPIVNAAMLAYEAAQRTGPVVSEKYMSEYETLIQKSSFFRQTTIETKDDFDKVFVELKDKKDVLFRGLSEAKYRLYSSLQRSWISHKIYEQGKTYDVFLRELIDNSKQVNGKVLEIYLEKVGLKSDNDIGILSFLQHYGCPTPLLDWTYNFSIALYFAIEGKRKQVEGAKINKYFSIYHLEEEHFAGSSLNEIVLQGFGDRGREIRLKAVEAIFNSFRERGVTDELIKQMLTEDELDYLILGQFGQGTLNFISRIEHIINSPILYFSDAKSESRIRFFLQNNMNIVNQEGAFTWNADPIRPLEQLAVDVYDQQDENIDYKFSKCININKDLIPYIQKQLIKSGIVRDFVYPNPWKIAKSAFKKTNQSPKAGGA